MCLVYKAKSIYFDAKILVFIALVEAGVQK